MSKIQEAINIIKKFHPALNVQKTDVEDIVFLFEYRLNKKTVGSEKITQAVDKAVKQQDFPKAVKYQDGMLFILKAETVAEKIKEEPKKEVKEEIEETIQEETPKKKGKKKKENVYTSESNVDTSNDNVDTSSETE